MWKTFYDDTMTTKRSQGDDKMKMMTCRRNVTVIADDMLQYTIHYSVIIAKGERGKGNNEVL